MNAADYLQQLMALKPAGRAWPDDPDARQNQTLAALAEEFARLDARALGLFAELNPRQAFELLTDFERNFGLPEACKVTPDTLAGRQAALHEKVIRQGGQSPAYFIQLANWIGVTITVSEFLTTHTVQSAVNVPLHDETWRFLWQVNTMKNIITRKTVQSAVSDPFANWGSGLLECIINQLKPAHTKVVFAYK